MCQYCDERGLPCLMCGRACMEYQMDRTRCRGCATAHRPPDVWPVFRFCPYCGRDLGKKENQNENQKQGEEEMARLIWTSEMDETVRRMEADGASDAEICEALGIEKTQLKNRRYNLQYNERKSCDSAGGNCKYEGPEQADCDTEDRQGGGILSDTERGLVRLVEEKEEEICELKRINGVLEESVDGFRMKVGELMATIDKTDRVIVKMAEQIYGEV